MKHLKIFENFNEAYKWPEAKFWLNKLDPEEICFLSLHSFESRKEKLFEVSYEGSTDAEPDEEGSGSFEAFFKIPIGKGYSTLSYDVSFSGSFTPYDSGDYYNPPEGGDYILEEIDIESAYYIDESEENEFDMLDFNFKSEFITKSDLIKMMEYFSLDCISYSDNETELDKPQIPQGLLDKCENIRKQNPDLISGQGLLNRFQ